MALTLEVESMQIIVPTSSSALGSSEGVTWVLSLRGSGECVNQGALESDYLALHSLYLFSSHETPYSHFHILSLEMLKVVHQSPSFCED